MLNELNRLMLTGELADDQSDASGKVPGKTVESILKIPDTCRLPSVFKTSELAVSSIALCAFELQKLLDVLQQPLLCPEINPRLASLWFSDSLRPLGWQAPEAWDAIAGDYKCADGWIRLHTNLAHHRKAALSVLGCAEKKDAVQTAVANWMGDELETAIVAEGGCAAAMRSLQAWSKHPQGQAVAAEPLIHWTHADVPATQVSENKRRLIAAVAEAAGEKSLPLSGLRVVDLTRVLAGPTATRLLAAFGADVLRIDPAGWSETYPTLEMSVGKTRAHLDLKTADGVANLETLIEQADVLIHGYRPGSLDRLGLDSARLHSLNPALIEASLRAYGCTGPWADRRGFDSLVQMSCGIAYHGMQVNKTDKPAPLPVQALDHATGYLLAASILRGLTHLHTKGRSSSARLSLARTAGLLLQTPLDRVTGSLSGADTSDFQAAAEITDWGPALRLKFPFKLPGIKPAWQIPAGELRIHSPKWRV